MAKMKSLKLKQMPSISMPTSITHLFQDLEINDMFNSDQYFKVAAYQGSITEKCPDKSIEITHRTLQMADESGVDVLLMPESFLHGYLPSQQEAWNYSVDLSSSEFSELCSSFSKYKTTLILGLNERSNQNLYNSAVVIEKGRCLGVYRKAYTYPPYDYYSLGTEFPVFEKNGIKYGVIICLDSVYLEPSRILALKGAKILFCPMFNRIPIEPKMPYFMNQKNHFRARSFENHCWFVASDVICSDKDGVSTGHACILNSDGEILSVSEPFTESLLTYSIPKHKLLENKEKRLIGNAELNSILQNEYNKRKAST